MISLEDKPCPVCGTTTSRLLHRASYPEHHYPGEFVLRRCTACRLLFNSPRLDEKELGELYGKNYYFFLRNDAREFDRIAAMYQRTVRRIEDEIKDKRSVDIGSGRGYFPALLRHLGWNASGIEISEDAAQYARSQFSLDVFTGTIEQYASSQNAKQFPLVTAIDVIEHVPSPDAFVAAASQIVEPGGWLIIDTPNGAAQNIQTKGVAWKGFNPFHIYLFSIENLTTLLALHGMKVTQSFSYGNSTARTSPRDNLIATLKKLGLMRAAAASYFALKKLTASNGATNSLDASTISRIKTEPSYSSSADSSGPLAAYKTGDNI